jgi:hypothetical protein
MKNRSSDLHNHLFAELERLGDEDLKGDALKAEIERATALSKIASQAIAHGQLTLNAIALASEMQNWREEMPALKLLTE